MTTRDKIEQLERYNNVMYGLISKLLEDIKKREEAVQIAADAKRGKTDGD